MWKILFSDNSVKCTDKFMCVCEGVNFMKVVHRAIYFLMVKRQREKCLLQLVLLQFIGKHRCHIALFWGMRRDLLKKANNVISSGLNLKCIFSVLQFF